MMIRKLILPALAVALLAGCAPYQYRDSASGDYYYGQPTTDYRYGGGYYDGYGYPAYGYPSSYGWGGSLGYGYGYYPYGGAYYGYPGYYPRRAPHHHNGHGHGHGGSHNGGGQDDGDHDGGAGDGTAGQDQGPADHSDRAPWRDLGRLRGRGVDSNLRSAPAAGGVRPLRAEQRAAPVQRSAPVQRQAPAPRTREAEPRSISKRDRRPISQP